MWDAWEEVAEAHAARESGEPCHWDDGCPNPIIRRWICQEHWDELEAECERRWLADLAYAEAHPEWLAGRGST